MALEELTLAGREGVKWGPSGQEALTKTSVEILATEGNVRTRWEITEAQSQTEAGADKVYPHESSPGAPK